MKRVRVNVTRAHAKHARKFQSCTECLLAVALREAFPQTFNMVSHDSIFFRLLNAVKSDATLQIYDNLQAPLSTSADLRAEKSYPHRHANKTSPRRFKPFSFFVKAPEAVLKAEGLL